MPLRPARFAGNGLGYRVRAVQLAASDRPGTAELEVAKHNWGDHRLRVAPDLDDGAFYQVSNRPTVTVPTARFGDVADQHGIDVGRIGMFWVDAQGHEGQILAGAGWITGADIPMVLEYWPYGLRRAEGLGLLHALVAEQYRRVIDVRASVSRGTVVDVAPNNLPGPERRYHSPVGYTNLLFAEIASAGPPPSFWLDT